MTNMTELKTNLRKLSGNYSKLIEKLRRLRNASAEVRKKLAITKQIADRLKEVEDLLTTTSRVLMAVQIVPPISVTAGNLKRAADKLKKSVTPLRQKADRVEKKVKPVREKLQVFEVELGKLTMEITKVKKQADQFLAIIVKTDDCIKGLARGKLKSELRQDLEAFAGKASPVVAKLNSVLVTILTRVDHIEKAIQKIRKATDLMAPILKTIQTMLNKLKVLKRGLDPVRKALEKKITVKIPFKKFTFTIKNVLTAIDKILGVVRKPLMKLAMKVLNPLLKKLKLGVDLKIPGLTKLRVQLDVLNVIPDLGLGATMKTLNVALGKMKLQSDSFDMVCPPK